MKYLTSTANHADWVKKITFVKQKKKMARLKVLLFSVNDEERKHEIKCQ